MTTLAYLRVSKDTQDTKNQRLAIFKLPGQSGWRLTSSRTPGLLAPLHHNPEGEPVPHPPGPWGHALGERVEPGWAAPSARSLPSLIPW